MCAQWNKAYDPDLLANGLEKIRITDVPGEHGGFEAYRYDDYVTVIHSSLDFSARIPEVERRRIIDRSISDVAKRGAITAQAIRNEISKAEQAFENLPQKRFVLATSLSAHYFDGMKKTVVRDNQITFSRSLPKRFAKESVFKDTREAIYGPLPTNYLAVRVSVKARSVHEAVEFALDTLDLLRGIWNLAFVVHRFWFSTSKRQPLNQIILGPIHTLHMPNGKLATVDVFWYEPDYVGPIKPLDLQKHWRGVHEYQNKVRRKLLKHKYGEELESFIRRYARALDTRDFEKGFLSLWSVFEGLTNTVKESNEVAIRRAAFLWDERDFHFQILKHLQNYRNRTVHAGHQTEQIEILLNQLKRYVEGLLKFHIDNFFGFSTIAEVGEFLNLSAEVPHLQKKLGMYRKALKFRS